MVFFGYGAHIICRRRLSKVDWLDVFQMSDPLCFGRDCGPCRFLLQKRISSGELVMIFCPQRKICFARRLSLILHVHCVGWRWNLFFTSFGNAHPPLMCGVWVMLSYKRVLSWDRASSMWPRIFSISAHRRRWCSLLGWSTDLAEKERSGIWWPDVFTSDSGSEEYTGH